MASMVLIEDRFGNPWWIGGRRLLNTRKSTQE
jgi:hypothetical protein